MKPGNEPDRTNPIVNVVDDDESVRTALTRLLRAAGHEVRSFASAGEFLFAQTHRQPGCVVLDIRMQGTGGLELQELLGQREESLPVVFLTGHGDISLSVRAMKAGAVDFLTKPAKRDALLDAVRTALARDAATRATRERSRKWQAHYDLLTAREREVFERVVAGKLNKQIAVELGTAERTVKAHRAHVMEKMGVESLAHLVHAADEMNLARSTRGQPAQL